MKPVVTLAGAGYSSPSVTFPGLPPVSIILMDIQMKRINGDDACMMMRNAGLCIPLLAMSGTDLPLLSDHTLAASQVD